MSPLVTWTTEDITPTLDEVGAILRARTRSDATGEEIGTFNADTRPTGVQVTEFITRARDLVLPRLPDEIPENLLGLARRLVALRAAMSIEVSYDPDRTGPDTAYARLKEEYDEVMAVLLELRDGVDSTVLSRAPLSVPLVSAVSQPSDDDDL